MVSWDLTVYSIGNWKEKLQEYIDPDQIPVYWGGTQTDPDGDPYCRSKVSVNIISLFYI